MDFVNFHMDQSASRRRKLLQDLIADQSGSLASFSGDDFEREKFIYPCDKSEGFLNTGTKKKCRILQTHGLFCFGFFGLRNTPFF